MGHTCSSKYEARLKSCESKGCEDVTSLPDLFFTQHIFRHHWNDSLSKYIHFRGLRCPGVRFEVVDFLDDVRNTCLVSFAISFFPSTSFCTHVPVVTFGDIVQFLSMRLLLRCGERLTSTTSFTSPPSRSRRGTIELHFDNMWRIPGHRAQNSQGEPALHICHCRPTSLSCVQ